MKTPKIELQRRQQGLRRMKGSDGKKFFPIHNRKKSHESHDTVFLKKHCE